MPLVVQYVTSRSSTLYPAALNISKPRDTLLFSAFLNIVVVSLEDHDI